MGAIITADIGGTHCRAAQVEAGRITWRASARTPASQGPHAVIDTLLELLGPVRDRGLPVGVAIAGQVSAGDVTADHLLRGWHGFPLADALSLRLSRPVAVYNDARAAAWGEYTAGAGRGVDEFLFVTVSSGVGAGLVLHGRLHLARNGLDAELGETLAGDGRTLEDHASGTALDRRAAALGHPDGPALCDAADAGDPAAEAALRHGIWMLAAKLADLSVMLGLQRCAVGGGLGLRPGYLARLREAMQALPARYRCELAAAELGADAGLLGAAALRQLA